MPATIFRNRLSRRLLLRGAGVAALATLAAPADLQRDKMNVRMRAVSDAHDPKAPIETLKSYVVENGRPGVVEA